MNIIELNYLKLKTFTEQNVSDYCLLNNINSDKTTELILNRNKLTDISGIKLFKNLKILYLNDNKIENISVLKDLKKLEKLILFNNKIKNISVLKDLNNLEILDIGINKIKDISVLKYLNNLKYLNISYLELESDQIQYIKSLKNLKELFFLEAFKDISVLNQLNKNIKIYK